MNILIERHGLILIQIGGSGFWKNWFKHRGE